MYKAKVFLQIIVVLTIVYWFVIFPLSWVYLKPEIEKEFDEKFWVSSIFGCAALLLFVLILLAIWSLMCWLNKRYIAKLNSGHGNLNSATIHNGTNKNIKNRVQMSELKLKENSEAGIYRDIHGILRDDKPNPNTATQTSGTNETFSNNLVLTPSSHKSFPFNDPRASGRLSYCDSCSKSMDGDDMVNIFLNKMWKNDNETNDVKFEVVGKSVNQAKRFHIDEIDGSSISTTMEKASALSVPVRHSGRLKSEIFIVINDDSTIQQTGDDDDVFK